MTIPPDVSEDTKATLLLCARFDQTSQVAKSLTQSEFHKLDNLLESHALKPSNMLEMRPNVLRLVSRGQEELSTRINSLIKQTKQLDEALLSWGKSGVWVVGERDKGYPFRLLQRLKKARSPLLFGAGSLDYLDSGGVCIVGSRDSQKSALRFSATLGDRCADENLTVISSDMRGVDREAVTSALDRSGRVIVVLSDRLEKSVTIKRYRQALADGLLTMVTPFSPNSGFSVSKAVRANRYQYALSDVAVIVESRRKGGIWSGADENRIEGWVPAFVRSGKTMSQGNLALQHLGLTPLTQDIVKNVQNLSDFFISHAINHLDDSAKREVQEPIDLFLLFMNELHSLAASQAKNEAEIIMHFNIEQVQVKKWLERAELEGKVRKTIINRDKPTWISCL